MSRSKQNYDYKRYHLASFYRQRRDYPFYLLSWFGGLICFVCGEGRILYYVLLCAGGGEAGSHLDVNLVFSLHPNWCNKATQGNNSDCKRKLHNRAFYFYNIIFCSALS
jgi:hypothetical protein